MPLLNDEMYVLLSSTWCVGESTPPQEVYIFFMTLKFEVILLVYWLGSYIFKNLSPNSKFP